MPVPISVLLFDLAGTRCALPAGAVGEILPVPRLSRPPGCPEALAGFADLGGRPLAVLALARLLGLADRVAPGLYGHLLVVAGADPALALLVDRAERVVEIDAGAVAPAAEVDRLAGCVAGEITLLGEIVALLDTARILDARERAVVAEQARRAAARAAAFAVGAP